MQRMRVRHVTRSADIPIDVRMSGEEQACVG